MPHLISKSRYVSGRQCLKKLYLSKHHKELAEDITSSQEALFEQGHNVGELAQQLFPGGKDATPEEYFDFGPAVAQTQNWIEAGETTIYEAAFEYDEVLAALDIFHRVGNEIHAIEVKSSTKVKDYHLLDGSLQYWVMNKCGYAPDKFFLMHINNLYIKNGAIEVDKLFHLEDITEQVIALQAEVEKWLPIMKSTLRGNNIPEVEIGPHCTDPFACDFMAYCWKNIPKDSVFELRNFQKKWDLYEEGITKIEDFPDDFPASFKTRLQIDGVKKSVAYIDKEAIRNFLKAFEFPLYFFDIETVFPGIPIFDYSKPYLQIPVQYSLHVLEQPDGELKHFEFLPNDLTKDPRLSMLETMVKQIGDKGSLVAYNMSFEKGWVGKIADYLLNVPKELKEKVDQILERCIDLMVPFQKGWYYNPTMEGSHSIKVVLPALCPDDPELNYKGLVINNGGDAANTLQALAEGKVPQDQISQLRKDLLAYCRLDTLAMVKIWEKLRNL